MIPTLSGIFDTKAGAIRFCLLCFGLLSSPLAAAEPLSGPPAAIRVDFTTDRISVTAIQGYSNRSTGRALMPDDPVRIASVSKLFVALGVMRLVESGTLRLEADVNDYLDWDLRHPAYPDRAITLAHLLSHTSGLRDGIDYALPMDARLEEELRNPQAWDGAHAPGAYFTYANLNFPVIAAVMESASGKRFDSIMRDEVFEPLRLDACFNWIGCSEARVAGAVTLYRLDGKVARDDLRGVRETCETVPARDGSCDMARYRVGQTGSVFSPQGGLRISAVDLARVGQMFLNDGLGFLTPASLGRMMQAEFTSAGPFEREGDSDNGYYCTYGLGVEILLPSTSIAADCDAAPTDTPYFGHSGEAYSLKSGLWWNPELGKGVAFFRTEVPEDDPSGHCIYFCD